MSEVSVFGPNFPFAYNDWITHPKGLGYLSETAHGAKVAIIAGYELMKLGALPGHYRYNHRMFGFFMQDGLPPRERGIFMAGDGVSWTPAWVEGAVQTSLNAVAGIIRHLDGGFHKENPSPCDAYAEWGPIKLSE